MNKKYFFVPKQNDMIVVTNKYDPNVDYYREREIRYGNRSKISTNKNKIKV